MWQLKKTRLFKTAFVLVGLVSCVILGSTARGSAQNRTEWVVVIHAGNPDDALPRAQVDAMFLGKIEAWPHGSEVLPINNQDGALRESFCQAIHSRTVAAVDAYWAAKAFGDYVSPPGKLDDQGVIDYVAQNAGAIGFVSKGAAFDGVKKLNIIDL